MKLLLEEKRNDNEQEVAEGLLQQATVESTSGEGSDSADSVPTAGSLV